jgi:murein L,D-transpeptidase YcbB/YkuD
MEKICMSGVRFNRLFVSSAVAILLSTGAIALAESPSDTPAVTGAPANADAPASAGQGSVQNSAAQVPANQGDEVPAPAAHSDEVPSANSTTVAAPPAPSVDGNLAIADQLRGIADGKFDRELGNKKERATIDAFYSGRGYAPLWLTDGKPNAAAKAAIAYLGKVDADGLEPSDYPVPDFSSSDPAALAAAELRLSASVITYAHHAAIGRVHWTRVSGDISYDTKAPDPADVLGAIAQSRDVAATLDGYEPHAPGYLALKAKLADIRDGKPLIAGKAPIASGPVLKVGMQDQRVPALRERLGLPEAADANYDKALADRVKKFQDQHDIRAGGTLTAATVDALNGKMPDHAADIIVANLERWRWMPHDLGKTYVMVNLPDYTLHVIDNGEEVWSTRVVDGKPNMPTPIMSAEMKYITVNPTWNVPPSIIAREYIPVLQQDPNALSRMGLNVTNNPDGTVHIAMPPGERNALGRLRFNFPNKFLVYQHDTPNKELFALDKRALSHGCMRVQNPVKYAEVLLGLIRPGEGYTEERIKKMFGTSEQDIQFPHYMPVHLTYQTAFVDQDGALQFRDDVYGRDKALIAILKGDERKVADTAIERKENVIRREALAMPEQPGFFGGGPNFFEKLFGGGSNPAPAPVTVHKRTQGKTASQRKPEIH